MPSLCDLSPPSLHSTPALQTNPTHQGVCLRCAAVALFASLTASINDKHSLRHIYTQLETQWEGVVVGGGWEWEGGVRGVRGG